MSPAFCLSAIINASPSLVIIPFIMESDIEDEFWFSLFSEIQPALSIFSIWCLLPTTCLLFCCLSEIWLQAGGQHSDYSGAARSNTMLQSWTADRQYIDLLLLPPTPTVTRLAATSHQQKLCNERSIQLSWWASKNCLDHQHWSCEASQGWFLAYLWCRWRVSSRLSLSILVNETVNLLAVRKISYQIMNVSSLLSEQLQHYCI